MRAFLVGEEPPCSLGYTYVNAPPYEAVVLGSLSIGQMLSFSCEEAETVLRMFKIAKECGCKFYMGSDAHHPKGLKEAKGIFERAIDMLGLTEDDKFIIKQI